MAVDGRRRMLLKRPLVVSSTAAQLIPTLQMKLENLLCKFAVVCLNDSNMQQEARILISKLLCLEGSGLPIEEVVEYGVKPLLFEVLLTREHCLQLQSATSEYILSIVFLNRVVVPGFVKLLATLQCEFGRDRTVCWLEDFVGRYRDSILSHVSLPKEDAKLSMLTNDTLAIFISRQAKPYYPTFDVGVFPGMDDLSTTFSKLNKDVMGPSAGLFGDRGSRENSSSAESGQGGEYTNWLHQNNYDSENSQEVKRWSNPSFSLQDPSILLNRTSSYPEQQHHFNQHLHFSSEPVPVPKSSFISYPPPGGGPPGGSPQMSPNQHLHHLNAQYGHQLPPSFNNMPHGPQFGGNLPDLSNGMFAHKKGIMSQQPPQQHRMHHQFQPSLNHLSGLQPPQMMNHHHLSPPPSLMNNFEHLGMGSRDMRPELLTKNRPGQQNFQSGFDTTGRPQFKSKYMSSDEIKMILRMQLAATHSNDTTGWPQFKSKYMSSDEIKMILRMQLAGTHSNDPYVDDYYPNQLRDCPPRARAANDQKTSDKPLEQEPLLTARVTIEEVDDIDRLLHFNNNLPDGGTQLRQRRQVLLEGLASSLQLVDPLGKNSQTVDVAPKDDRVFLRLVSLPKGRKLLKRYLEHLSPGSELTRIVCMAIFRHLRSLFGALPVDPRAVETTNNLVMTISSSVKGMELKSLGECLASVVSSTEQPPLRPARNPADGGSVVLRLVLERATELLTDPNAASNCSVSNRELWQASFDAFFGLLTKYCISKYDTGVLPLMSHGGDMAVIRSDVAKAITREMPVELLRASLPHINENQRKILLDFAQRSMPNSGG